MKLPEYEIWTKLTKVKWLPRVGENEKNAQNITNYFTQATNYTGKFAFFDWRVTKTMTTNAVYLQFTSENCNGGGSRGSMSVTYLPWFFRCSVAIARKKYIHEGEDAFEIFCKRLTKRNEGSEKSWRSPVQSGYRNNKIEHPPFIIPP